MTRRTPDLGYLTTSAEFHPLNICPWCRSEDLAPLTVRGDGLPVLRCRSCHLGFLGMLPDDISVFYDDDYYVRSPIPGTAPAVSGYEDYERSFTPSSFRWLTSLIAATAGNDGKLFDLGAATGTFLEMARIEGFDVHGAELTEAGASAARAKGLDVRSGLFDPSDWGEGTFDVVTALEVLEHVTDLHDILAGLDSVLTDDGLLVFFVPNVTDTIIETYGDDALDFNKSYDHTLFFNPTILRTIFEDVFGEGSLTLFTADVEQWGQGVSSALGFVRKTPTTSEPPEQRLLNILEGASDPEAITNTDEAIAVALSAAKFFEHSLADQAVDIARDLGASDERLATVRAQVLRNRGEIFNAIEILEAGMMAGSEDVDPLAGPLLVEILGDLTVLIGVREPGLAVGLRKLHEMLDGSEILKRAIEQVKAREVDLVRRAEQADARALAAMERATEANRERDRTFEMVRELEGELTTMRHRADETARQLQDRIRRHESEIAAANRDRADLVDRINALEGETAQLRWTLDQIYSSRAWKLASAAWKITRFKPGRRSTSTDTHAEDPDPDDAPTDPLVSTESEARTFPVTVSVIMPVYNKGRTIRESVDSVLSQTLRDLELLIWDDGSSDEDTDRAITDIAMLDRVRVFRAQNQGVIGARNSAMRLADGEFIVCLDPDDRFNPTYLEKAVSYLRSHPEISIVYPWQQTVGGKVELWETQDLDPAVILEANHLPVCSVFRREVFIATGGFSSEMTDGAEDWEFWAHAAELGFRGRVIPEKLFEYTYSDDPDQSRDAVARERSIAIANRIRSLHPGLVGSIEQPGASVRAPETIDLDPPALPRGVGRPVILTLPWFTIGGADRVVAALVDHWGEAGRTVVVITTLGVGPGMLDRVNELLDSTPYVYQLPSILPERLWYEFVDRIITALPDATLLNIGSSWTHEHAIRLKEDHPDLRIVDQQFNDTGHLAANHEARTAIDTTVIAYQGLRDRFLEDGRPDDEVVCVYVGIEPVDVDTAAIREARTELTLGDDDRFVAYVGRLSEEKRPEWLLPLADAVGRLGAKVVVVGSGPLAAELSGRFEAHPDIIWVPYLDDTGSLFAAAEATVLPSRIEGIPLTAMESLASGTPVVATAVGGLPELEDVPGMHLVDSSDRSVFIAAVESVLGDDTVASITLPGHLTMDGMLERYDDIIDGPTG